MARRKQVAPMQRINSGEIMRSPLDNSEKRTMYANGHIGPRSSLSSSLKTTTAKGARQKPAAGLLQLLVCVGGIYASFLTWGLLQERITKTAYQRTDAGAGLLRVVKGKESRDEYWRFPVVLNGIQSLCALVSGGAYLMATAATTTTRRGEGGGSLLPAKAAAFAPLFLVALTSTLASPFGYAALGHVDYLTFVLAKSCKLLPVMFLHVVLYGKRYPLAKYAVVLAVTAGVAVFTIYHPPKEGTGVLLVKEKKTRESSYYGLALLAVNLLFDGLTNTTQDHIFGSPARYGRVSSSQMMVITNAFASLLMALYLLVTPHLPQTLVPPFAQTSSTHELSAAMAFLQRHPSVWYDVLGFSVCGAVGQLFIFATLERFSSLLLVTVTVTRKMLTMVLSVVWYGKRLSGGQWMGVGLVFGGIGTEAWLASEEKRKGDDSKSKGKEKEKER